MAEQARLGHPGGVRFGPIHRFSTGALAALGAGSLLLTRALDDTASAAALAALAAALLLPARVRERRGVRLGIRGLLACGVVAAVALDPAPSAASPAAALLVAAQIERLSTRRGANHDAAILALSLAHFVFGALLGGGALQGAGLALAMLVGPLALGLSMLRRQVEANALMGARDRLGRGVDVRRILRSERVVEGGALRLLLFWSAAPALLAVAFFVLLPRSSAPALAGLTWESSARPGSRPSADRLSPSVVLLAEATEDAVGVYFRRQTLDRFDGRSWDGAPPSPTPRAAQAPWPRGLRTVWTSRNLGSIEAPYDEAGLLPAAPAEPPERLAFYLALPPRSPALAELARSWTEGASTPLDRVRAIEARLRRDYAYTMDSPSRGAASPLSHFLLTSRQGHCELFAGAMAALVRELGVPSRVASGYLARSAGDRKLLARGTDAHAWVEAYVDGAWRRFDPTPASAGAPLRRALDPLDWGLLRGVDHRELVRARMLAVLALLGGLVTLARALGSLPSWASPRWALPRWAWGRSRPTAAGADGSAMAEQRALYEQLDRALAAQGLARPPGVPPLQHAQSEAVRAHPLSPLIAELTAIYLRARFGGEPLDDEQRRAFARRAREIEAYQPGAPAPAGPGSPPA